MTIFESYLESLKASQNEPILLSEDWGSFEVEPLISESTSDGNYLTGILMQAETVNRNKRWYPKRVLEKAVSDYLSEHEGKLKLGELSHPPRADVDPLLACIHIEDMWWEGNNVMGCVQIIEGDGAEGDKLKSLIEAGWIPGVSSRGLGSLTESDQGYYIVNEGFRITCPIDVVCSPSAPDAFLKVSQ